MGHTRTFDPQHFKDIEFDKYSVSITVMTAFGLIIAAFFKFVIRVIDFYMKNQIPQLYDIIQRLYKELMVCSAISMFVFVSKFTNFVAHITSQDMPSMMYDLVTLLFITGFFVYTIFIVYLMLLGTYFMNRWTSFEQSIPSIMEERSNETLEIMKSRPLLVRYTNIRLLIDHLRFQDAYEYHLVRSDFIINHDLSDCFEYSSYLRKCIREVIARLLKIHWSVWFLVFLVACMQHVRLELGYRLTRNNHIRLFAIFGWASLLVGLLVMLKCKSLWSHIQKCGAGPGSEWNCTKAEQNLSTIDANLHTRGISELDMNLDVDLGLHVHPNMLPQQSPSLKPHAQQKAQQTMKHVVDSNARVNHRVGANEPRPSARNRQKPRPPPDSQATSLGSHFDLDDDQTAEAGFIEPLPPSIDSLERHREVNGNPRGAPNLSRLFPAGFQSPYPIQPKQYIPRQTPPSPEAEKLLRNHRLRYSLSAPEVSQGQTITQAEIPFKKLFWFRDPRPLLWILRGVLFYQIFHISLYSLYYFPLAVDIGLFWIHFLIVIPPVIFLFVFLPLLLPFYTIVSASGKFSKGNMIRLTLLQQGWSSDDS